MKCTFSIRELTVINSALFTAREEYHKHAATAKGEGLPRIEEQFLAQARDCSDLIEKTEALQDQAIHDPPH